MQLTDALFYFGDGDQPATKMSLAKKLGISAALVSQWKNEIPELYQYRLELMSNGELRATKFRKKWKSRDAS